MIICNVYNCGKKKFYPTHYPVSIYQVIPQVHLASHPDREFAAFIMQGLQDGFRIGFDDLCDLPSLII